MAVREFLRAYLSKGIATKVSDFEIPPCACFNVTLRVKGMIRGSMSGSGETFGKQIEHASHRAALDNRFSGALVKADLPNVCIEVWIQQSAQRLTSEELLDHDALMLGKHGVEVRMYGYHAYYKPSVAITSGFRTPQEMFCGVCEKAGLPADAWKLEHCEIWKTEWIHLCEVPGGQIVQLERLRTDPKPIDRDCLRDWISSGARYLVANQHADGSYCYRYDAINGKELRDKGNTVRASGCAYAMAWAASIPAIDYGEELSNSAIRTVDGILSTAIEWTDGGLIIPEGPSVRSGKLGSTALLASALMTPALRSHYAPFCEQLLISINDAQQSTGLFRCVFGAADDSPESPNYYPGQALLAFATKAAHGDFSYLRTCHSAFPAYCAHFRKRPTTAFVGWQADAWSRLAEYDSGSEYSEFVFEQVDWILQFQLGAGSSKEWRGGFVQHAGLPNVSTSVYTEAIARGAILARRLKMEERWIRYKSAVQAGLRFCSQLRIGSEQTLFLRHPERAIGGVTGSLTKFEVRSDNVQHLMTMALTVLEEPELLEGA